MNERLQVSVYRYAARNGIVLGIWLSAMALCFMLSLRLPQLSFMLLLLTVGIPFVVGAIMWQVCKREPHYCRFTPLWLMGIYTFIFGSLIAAAVSAAWLLLVDPSFLYSYISNALALFKSAPAGTVPAAELTMLQQAIENKAIPSPMQFVFTMIWTTSFLGSLLSMAIAAVMTIICRSRFQSTDSY
jgi:hypothetical protein